MRSHWVALLLGLTWLAGPALTQVVRNPKGKLAKGGPAKKARLLEQFNQLPPEQKQKVLQKLPEERRKLLEENNAKFRQLPPEQRNRLQNQYENFAQLSPEKQQSARRAFRQMNQLPVEERRALRREVTRVSRMSEGERKSYLASDEFKAKRTPEEREMIGELSGLVPRTPPPPPPAQQ